MAYKENGRAGFQLIFLGRACCSLWRGLVFTFALGIRFRHSFFIFHLQPSANHCGLFGFQYQPFNLPLQTPWSSTEDPLAFLCRLSLLTGLLRDSAMDLKLLGQYFASPKQTIFCTLVYLTLRMATGGQSCKFLCPVCTVFWGALPQPCKLL